MEGQGKRGRGANDSLWRQSSPRDHLLSLTPLLPKKHENEKGREKRDERKEGKCGG